MLLSGPLDDVVKTLGIGRGAAAASSESDASLWEVVVSGPHEADEHSADPRQVFIASESSNRVLVRLLPTGYTNVVDLQRHL